MRARAKGMALSNMSNWLCNFAVAFATPPLFAALHGAYYFVLVGSCVISGIVVYCVYPETAHRTLEELAEVFQDAVPPSQCEKLARAISTGTATGVGPGAGASGGAGWLEVPGTRGANGFSDPSSTLRASFGDKERPSQDDSASKLEASEAN